MQGDVLDRRRHLPHQVEEDLALRGGERLARSGYGHHAHVHRRLAHPPQRARQGIDAVALAGDEVVLSESVRLGGDRDVLDRLGGLPRLGLRSIVAAQGDRPVLGPARSQRRLDDHLEQALAIQARRERLADPSHRPVDLHLLAAQLLHLGAEAVAHLVELARQARHLVVSEHRYLATEVALADPSRRVKHRPHLAAEHAQKHGHEDHGNGEEHHEGGGDHGARGEEAPRLHRAKQRELEVPGAG